MISSRSSERTTLKRQKKERLRGVVPSRLSSRLTILSELTEYPARRLPPSYPHRRRREESFPCRPEAWYPSQYLPCSRPCRPSNKVQVVGTRFVSCVRPPV